MTTSEEPDITGILRKASDGDDTAINRLSPLVYDELRALAGSYLQRERPNHTLPVTALVHEAYIRLIRQEDIEGQNRAHFFAVPAQATRPIFVDHARAHRRAKRVGGRKRIRLGGDIAILKDRDLGIIALNDAMGELENLHGRQAPIVELRFFGGLTLKDVA